MKYSVIDKFGNVIKSGTCPAKSLNIQAGLNEEVVTEMACDIEDKFVKGSDGEWKKQKRSKEEINARKDTLRQENIPHGQQVAGITNDQLKSLMDRIAALEKQLI